MIDRRKESCANPVVVCAVLFFALSTNALAAQHLDEETAKNIIVMVEGRIGGAPTIGAGIICAAAQDRLYMVTANHVVRRGQQEADDLVVTLRWLPGEKLPVQLLRHVDRNLDLAVLSLSGIQRHAIPADKIPFTIVGRADALKRGDEVYHVGNPNGNAWRINVRPDALEAISGGRIRFETNTIAPGSSGGGLFNSHYELFGMVKSDRPPVGVAIEIKDVMEKLTEWAYPVNLAKTRQRPFPETPDTGALPPAAQQVSLNSLVSALLGEAPVRRDIQRLPEKLLYLRKPTHDLEIEVGPEVYLFDHRGVTFEWEGIQPMSDAYCLSATIAYSENYRQWQLNVLDAEGQDHQSVDTSKHHILYDMVRTADEPIVDLALFAPVPQHVKEALARSCSAAIPEALKLIEAAPPLYCELPPPAGDLPFGNRRADMSKPITYWRRASGELEIQLPDGCIGAVFDPELEFSVPPMTKFLFRRGAWFTKKMKPLCEESQRRFLH